jgi:hypothetical protein
MAKRTKEELTSLSPLLIGLTGGKFSLGQGATLARVQLHIHKSLGMYLEPAAIYANLPSVVCCGRSRRALWTWTP